MLYRIGHFIFSLYFKLFYRLRITGKEHVPGGGPLLICSNHISWIDPLLLGSVLPVKLKVHFMAKEELFHNRFFAFILKKIGAFPVNRAVGDYAAIKKAYQLLQEGKVLFLFPEGSRSMNGQLQKAKDGAALIAGRRPVPILPAAVIGPYRIGRPLQVKFGPTFTLPDFEFAGRQEKKAMLGKMSALIMEKIRDLLPVHMHSDNNALD
jgi:1-acyl-sn-glycerol-3-phosphate acyltransferase